MGVFGVFFGCRGVVGFNGCCSGVSKGDGGFTVACVSGCSGVVGFKAATWLCPEREKVRPARLKRPKNAVFRRVGRVISRVSPRGPASGRTFSRKCRWRGCVGRVFSRIPAPRPGIRGTWCPTCGKGWGFALHEAFQGCVVGVSEPHVVQFPRLAAAKPRREAVCSPNCRPIGQRTLKIGHFEAMGLHFGGIGVCKRVG